MPETKKCADCGYLAVRNRETTQLEEATQSVRNSGILRTIEVFPECAVLAMGIKNECHAQPKRFCSVISAERECDEHTKWMPGFSPKEHLEMNILQKEREQQRAFQERMASLQKEIADSDHNWREAQADRERQWRKEDRSTALVGLAVGVGLGIIATVVTLIAANKLPWFS